MEKKFGQREWNAIHGIFAAGLGIALFYIRNNWTPAMMIAGTFFELFYIFAFYMYVPFVLSLLCLSAVDYAIELLRRL